MVTRESWREGALHGLMKVEAPIDFWVSTTQLVVDKLHGLPEDW